LLVIWTIYGNTCTAQRDIVEFFYLFHRVKL